MTLQVPIYEPLVDLDTGRVARGWVTWFTQKFAPSGNTAGNQIWQQSGVPGASLGNNGDYYFRTDGSGSNHLYFKTGGSWTALV